METAQSLKALDLESVLGEFASSGLRHVEEAKPFGRDVFSAATAMHFDQAKTGAAHELTADATHTPAPVAAIPSAARNLRQANLDMHHRPTNLGGLNS